MGAGHLEARSTRSRRHSAEPRTASAPVVAVAPEPEPPDRRPNPVPYRRNCRRVRLCPLREVAAAVDLRIRRPGYRRQSWVGLAARCWVRSNPWVVHRGCWVQDRSNCYRPAGHVVHCSSCC